MPALPRPRTRFGLAFLCASAAGWAATPVEALAQSRPPSPPTAARPPAPTTVVRSAGYDPPGTDAALPAATELSADALVEQILERNPTLTQMEATAAAAAARYPQAISLDDPMFAATFGPGTIAPDDPGVEFGSRLEFSQKYPWPGKRRLRGENAAAEARAAGQDVEDMRLQLAQTARDAFADYYLAGRGLDVNKKNLDLLEGVQSNQESLFKTGKIPEQDLLLTKVEIGRQRERILTLERMLQVARARINTLLHLPPDAPLPPPPEQLPAGGPLPDEAALRAAALAQRPDLKALAEHVAAEQAQLALAYKEYYPDLEPSVMYDRFMGNTSNVRDLALMVGVRINVPLRLSKRDAAVQEAMARVNARLAELNRLTDDVNFAVAQAYAEVGESGETVELYEKHLLPDAELNVKTLETRYTTASTAFINLLDAERSLIELRDRYYEITADAFRRRAALERAVGGPLDPAAAETLPGAPCGSASGPVLRPAH